MEDNIELIMTEFEGMRWCSEHELKRVCKELNNRIEHFKAENARYRKALEFGLNEMMPEIKAQKGCWPGEVDDFEDRAREALKGDST